MNEEGNPYKPPEIPVEVVTRDELALDYWRPLSFVFESANWLTNGLLIAVCMIIPIVGPMVLLGYQHEVIIALLTRPREECPDFDFNRFTEYLTRGVMPFLVQLVFGMLIFFVVGFLTMIAMFIVMAIAANISQDAAGIAMVTFMTLVYIAIIPLNVAMHMFILPLTLRAGLTKDFAEGMKLGYAIQFARNTWVQMLIFAGVVMLAGFVAFTVGLMIFCVGVYFTMGLLFIAQAHIHAQLYRLNCVKGGETIPIVT